MITNPSPKSVLKKYPDGSIFQGFGENVLDYTPIGYTGGHPGWDILAYQGAPLVACADSYVQRIESDPKRLGGLAVVLCDNSYLYGYGHLDAIKCVLGQKVKAGDVIGTMGNTGFVISGGTKYWGNAPAGKGVHCHFGITPVVMNNGTPNIINAGNGTGGAIDPTPFFADSIKAEIPDPKISLLQKVVELLRALIRRGGQEPVV